MPLDPKELQDLLDEVEASRRSRKRAWENLAEIRCVLKDAAGVELPPPKRKTIDLEGRIVKDRQLALHELVKAIRDFRRFTDELLTLHGGDYAHAFRNSTRRLIGQTEVCNLDCILSPRSGNHNRTITMGDPYEIHHVDREDLNEGWIWVRNENLKESIENHRPVLLIKDTGTRKKVCCETVYADDTWLQNRRKPMNPPYTKNMVFMSGWYRRRLRIEGEKLPCKRSLDIKFPNPVQAVWWQLRACVRHPQIGVVMSTVLAVVGTGLGIVGLGAVLKEMSWCPEYVSQTVDVFGFLVFVLGFLPLFLRARR